MAAWYPPASYGPREPALVSIGDIVCTQSQVFTPQGVIPIGQVRWGAVDQTRLERRIPQWAIICAVIGFFVCFLGLLFLLAKETVVIGQVQVTVYGPTFAHATYVPIEGEIQRNDVHARVYYAQSLSAAVQ